MIELLDINVVEFGLFRLDVQTRQLTRRVTGERIPLSPKAMEVLICLAKNANEVVSKEQLLDEVWNNVFIEEANLSQTIFVLRKALGDESKNPAYILTVPNRGYRFIADIARVAEANASAAAGPSHVQARPVEKPFFRTTLAYILIASLVLFTAIAFVFFVIGSRKREMPTGPTAVAVLPFRNLGPADDDFVAAGLSESTTTRLSNLKNAVVRPMASTLKYANAAVDPKVIGNDLGVEIIVTGSIQRIGDSIRVNTQVIRVADGAAFWGRIYDDRFRSLFSIQDRMSLDLAEAIAANLTPDERARIARNYASDPDAQLRYFQGVFLWNKRTPQSLEAAIIEFRKAIETEPGYVHAYVGLANCYAVLSNYGAEKPTVANPKAREAIDTALRIDENNAEAYAVRGTIQAYYDWDWNAAGESFRRAVEINPNYATGQQWYAEYLFDIKRYDEAFERYKTAIRLDPRSPTIRTSYASRFLFLRDFDKVIELMQLVHDIDGNYGYAYFHQGLAYEQLGREREAFESFVKLMRLMGEPEECAKEAEGAFERGGLKEYWRVRLDQLLTRPHLRNFPPNGIASVFARNGDAEKTIEFLQKGIEEHDPWMAGLSHPLYFELVKDDPRFLAIVRRLNFPQP